MRKFSLAACLLLLAFLIWPARQVVSQQVREVWVSNFPDLQTIQGEVSIKEPIPSASLFTREGVVVPPAPRHQTTSMIDGGVIETLGFTHLSLSLQGELRGTEPRDGQAGALLIPDQAPVLRAFHEDSRLQFPLEVEAKITAAEAPWIASEPNTWSVAFPRYRIYFYNTSNRTVEVNLYGYLKN